MTRLVLLLFVVASMIFISHTRTVQKRSLPDYPLEITEEVYPKEMTNAKGAAVAEMAAEGGDVEKIPPEEEHNVDKNEGEKIGYVEFTDLAEMPGEDGDEKQIEPEVNDERDAEEGSKIQKRMMRVRVCRYICVKRCVKVCSRGGCFFRSCRNVSCRTVCS